jgi:hypothetical protein
MTLTELDQHLLNLTAENRAYSSHRSLGSDPVYSLCAYGQQ